MADLPGGKGMPAGEQDSSASALLDNKAHAYLVVVARGAS